MGLKEASSDASDTLKSTETGKNAKVNYKRL